RHPRSRVQFCHCTASALSTSAIAGDFAGGCAAATPTSRLIMAQARANPFGQLFDIIGLLQGCHGEDEAVVLFQIDLELFGELRQIGGVLDVGLVLRLENLVALQLAVRQPRVLFRLAAAAPLRKSGSEEARA